LAFKTELLFQHFRKLESQKMPWKGEAMLSQEFENRTAAKWQRICARHLYKKAPRDFVQALKKHPYLRNLVRLAQRTPLTITYNFDDFLELALRQAKSSSEEGRGFETVVNPWTQFRRKESVVYHPNGVIKSELMELPVDRFVFSESSFARQTVGMAGDATFMVNHLCKNTCLLIGSSLEDDSLRTTLIQSAATNSGSFHYCVHFLRGKTRLRAKDEEAIRKANFNVFNLVTLFLNEEEIESLGALIDPEQVSDKTLMQIAKRVNVPLAYRFYLTGAIGVGKSTVSKHLQNLSVLDEWVETRLSTLAKPWDTLTGAERKPTDAWINKQFHQKNETLWGKTIGMFLVDRPPLDPLVFAPLDDRPARAKSLVKAICRKRGRVILDGAICILRGEPKELSVRVMATGRDGYTADKVLQMQDTMATLYAGPGAFPLETCGMSVSDVTKKVAELICFEPYVEFKMHELLTSY
jgi:hypothetical protein